MLKELRPKRQEDSIFFVFFVFFVTKNRKNTTQHMTDREKLPCDPLHAKQATSCVLFCFVSFFFFLFVL
jgi:hypothetical protein